LELKKDLYNEIFDYCRVNGVTQIDDFINDLIISGFNIEKYGNAPIKPKEIIKEIEKIVEVPVDRIVEKIVEVPVDRIQEVLITNNDELENLTNTINLINKENSNLKGELSEMLNRVNKKIEEISQLKENIDELNKKIKELENNKKDFYGE
jgi:DNA repair exonuclease SbcCD ATPase subunit